MTQSWRIAADTGGTFTDVLGYGTDGRLERAKVLSSGVVLVTAKMLDRCTLYISAYQHLPEDFFAGYSATIPHRDDFAGKIVSSKGETLIVDGDWKGSLPEDTTFTLQISAGEEAPVLGARLLTGTPLGQLLPVREFRLATTRGTNALLEEKGVDVVFFVTKGFGDLLRIHDQKRPDLFALNPKRPEPIHAGVVEVDERLDAGGEILRPLNEDDLRQDARKWVRLGYLSACVAFLHSYRYPGHEQRAAEILREEGFSSVTESARLSARRKFLPRAETALVDAYLDPILEEYLSRVQTACGDARLRVMDSAGELRMVEHYRAKDSLVSGPAAGVMGVALLGQKVGGRQLLSFDMGGTSTDVARVDQWPDRSGHCKVGRAFVLGESLRIETVAAGGGSVCGYRNGKFFVGPDSAGADPGPACYGKGGPLTITDANLLLGRLPVDGFPMPITEEASEKKLAELKEQIRTEGGILTEREELLTGFLMLANQRMADAISGISIREGYNPENHVLLAFGGAGGQHACAIAEQLGMKRILSPADAGLLSAYGLQEASVGRTLEEEIIAVLTEKEEELAQKFAKLENEAMTQLEEEGFSHQQCEIRTRDLFLRFAGQEVSHPIPWKENGIESVFREHYKNLFGYVPDRPVELVRIRIIAHATGNRLEKETFPDGDNRPQPERKVKLYLGEKAVDELVSMNSEVSAVQGVPGWCWVPLYHRQILSPGSELMGPCLVVDPYSCLLIEPNWRGRVGSAHSIRVDQNKKLSANVADRAQWIQRELFSHRLTHIATEMGEQLRRTALSTNIKERLDFSCAILDAEGRLITNAPHIPVHLGALGVCVRRCVELLQPGEGDTIITNHPAYGGSHLPDITLITPVYSAEGSRLLGYVANRAHHAELGGIVPGSMPPLAKSLAEEGVVIPPRFLYRNGASCREEWLEWMKDAPHPSRDLEENLADLDAQVAANRLGLNALQELCGEYGLARSAQFLKQIFERSGSSSEQFFQKYEGKELQAEEKLDGGGIIRVRYRFFDGGVEIDFTGTSSASLDNPCATPAIVRSAIIYVVRLLLGEDITLNEGLLQRVKTIIPSGCLLSPIFDEDPAKCPPVVAGNVELSQRLVDTLLKPFELVACSQGTMNNLLFGGKDEAGYYETICGGAGAGPADDGASCIHTHMTNTAITDPEILECRYPVRLNEFSRRKNSGGAGSRAGGDGVIREIVFLAPSKVSILSQHRKEGPYGCKGGAPGQPGRQFLIRNNGEKKPLPHNVQMEVQLGEAVRVETPGGGGYG